MYVKTGLPILFQNNCPECGTVINTGRLSCNECGTRTGVSFVAQLLWFLLYGLILGLWGVLSLEHRAVESGEGSYPALG